MALYQPGVCKAASELADALKLEVGEYEVWADQVLEEELWRSAPGVLSVIPHLTRVGAGWAYPRRGGEREAHRGTCPTLVLYLSKRNTPQIKVSPYFN